MHVIHNEVSATHTHTIWACAYVILTTWTKHIQQVCRTADVAPEPASSSGTGHAALKRGARGPRCDSHAQLATERAASGFARSHSDFEQSELASLWQAVRKGWLSWRRATWTDLRRRPYTLTNTDNNNNNKHDIITITTNHNNNNNNANTTNSNNSNNNHAANKCFPV